MDSPYGSQNKITSQVRFKAPDGESYIRRAEYNLTMTKELNSGYIDCEFWPEDNLDRIARQRLRLYIMYPPDPPQITTANGIERYKEGQLISLECLVKNGNPPPSIEWRLGESYYFVPGETQLKRPPELANFFVKLKERINDKYPGQG
ncbi:hypothetical protein Ciccas_009172 [Cichlidogyrus casuarinus]|uniref:Ig-like domain-containing protein n=1 Tax=Cichlidogyrus casuarinus TaxID=1844966 RepID=A0ABD2PYT0_9PLAT